MHTSKYTRKTHAQTEKQANTHPSMHVRTHVHARARLHTHTHIRARMHACIDTRAHTRARTGRINPSLYGVDRGVHSSKSVVRVRLIGVETISFDHPVRWRLVQFTSEVAIQRRTALQTIISKINTMSVYVIVHPTPTPTIVPPPLTTDPNTGKYSPCL